MWYKRANMQITRQIDYFCREYVTDFDGPRSARAAGISRSTSSVKARLWLADAAVNERIGELYQAKVDKIPDVVMSPQEVLVRLSKIAGSDIRAAFDEAGEMLGPHEIGEDVAAAVESYKAGTEKSAAELKFASKLNALKMLGEHHNVFEKHEKNKAANVTVNIEGKDRDL